MTIINHSEPDELNKFLKWLSRQSVGDVRDWIYKFLITGSGEPLGIYSKNEPVSCCIEKIYQRAFKENNRLAISKLKNGIRLLYRQTPASEYHRPWYHELIRLIGYLKVEILFCRLWADIHSEKYVNIRVHPYDIELMDLNSLALQSLYAINNEKSNKYILELSNTLFNIPKLLPSLLWGLQRTMGGPRIVLRKLRDILNTASVRIDHVQDALRKIFIQAEFEYLCLSLIEAMNSIQDNKNMILVRSLDADVFRIYQDNTVIDGLADESEMKCMNIQRGSELFHALFGKNIPNNRLDYIATKLSAKNNSYTFLESESEWKGVLCLFKKHNYILQRLYHEMSEEDGISFISNPLDNPYFEKAI